MTSPIAGKTRACMKGAPLFLLEAKKSQPCRGSLKGAKSSCLLPATARGVGLSLWALGAAAEAMGPLSSGFASWCPMLAGQRAGSSWGQVAALLCGCLQGHPGSLPVLLFLQWKVLSKLFPELCFPRHWSLSGQSVCVPCPSEGPGQHWHLCCPCVSVCIQGGLASGLFQQPGHCQHPEGDPPVHGSS